MASTLIKPVIIPAEILSLEDANLSEKLTLALFAANPEITESRVRRLVGIKQDGLRILKDRLVQKRFLTQRGGRHLICVPGLVYRDDPEGGHFVPEIKGQENGQKVALQTSDSCAVEIKPLLVPAELLDCRYLIASEKLLLAYYLTAPDAPNEQVLVTLGISRAGLKKLKRGLLDRKVLVHVHDGYTIRLPGLVLVRDAQGGHFVPELEYSKNGYKVALPPPQLPTAMDICDEWTRFLDSLAHRPTTLPSDLREYTARMLQRVEVESPEGPERDLVVDLMKSADDGLFAMQFVHDNVPQRDANKFLSVILEASKNAPAKLTAFREQIEGRNLAGVPKPRLLGMFSETMSQ